MEQELLTHLDHTSSSPISCEVCVARSLVLCVMFCRLLFVLFLLAIVLSVLHRYTDSDYPFGIFKLFLHTTNVKSLLHVVGMLLDAYLKEEPPNDHSISFCFKFALWSPNDHSISFCFKFVLWFPRRIFYMKFCQNKPNLCICNIFVSMKLQV